MVKIKNIHYWKKWDINNLILDKFKKEENQRKIYFQKKK
jgi:hypothetical protein